MISSSQPIGIFDSGLGGLTVADAIMKELPNENIVYVGDIAHLPYGDKSASAIQHYTKNICEFLLKKNCKLILIACNTASAVATEVAQETVKNRALLLDVIHPTIQYLAKNFQGKKLGMIGTRQTILSKIYPTLLSKAAPHIEVSALATPLLAPMIEEGFIHAPISELITHTYLAQEALKNIDALLLACTHYPVIKSSIANYYAPAIPLIESGPYVAQEARHLLEAHHTLNTQKNSISREFYVTDKSPAFEKTAGYFFKEPLNWEYCPMWD